MVLKLNKLDRKQYKERSSIIHQTLYQTDNWKAATMIGITISRFPEVDTYEIIRKAWSEGKKVTAPRCIHKTREMHFHLIKSFNDVSPSYFDLLEPEPSLERVEPGRIDLLFVPGLAFDSKGFRLGYGGGYFDRFLSYYNGNTISLCFTEQVLDAVPVEAHDLPVKRIIGEGLTLKP
ncbi:5-formyltetrahydrofolate cyclo-ligase [Jeotgalibacillus proteolyticus]|uniref:5-formyltetrahydrofolate cyclo-ligase n=2 Tax=Jeotgalibacillus proteolyticus TaxID=2082395 RepID=A0A2S5GFJ9_9BACL|nr:5-formyltetrahydrofolate cyclo-ligase [Jeotgalibacillus proteolyticus]